jgi:hypothetical protein
LPRSIVKPWGQFKPPLGWQARPSAVTDLGLSFAALFNEDGGLQIYDATGNNTIGILSGTTPPAWMPGQFGTSLKFDGSTSYIDCGTGQSTADLTNTVPGSWSFWVNLVANDIGTVAARNDGNLVNGGWWLTFTAGNLFTFQVERNTFNGIFRMTSPAIGSWHHIVVTCTTGNSPTVALYLDGASKAVTISAAGTGVSATDATKNLILGRWSTAVGGGNGFLSGQLDNFLICKNHILTPDEVLRLYVEPFWWMQQPTRKTYYIPSGGSNAYTRTATDVPTTTDIGARAAVLARALADAPATTDAVVRLGTLFRILTDAPTTVDAVTRGQVLTRSLTDAPATTDAVVRVETLFRVLTDAPTTTDAATRAAVLARALTDAPTTSDGATRTFAGGRTAGDAPTTTDIATGVHSGAGRTAADSPNTSDVATRIEVLARALTDAPTSTDAVARVGTFARSLTDAPATTDAAIGLLALIRTLADAPQSSDAGTRRFTGLRSVMDAVASVDNSTGLAFHAGGAPAAPSVWDGVQLAFTQADAIG